MKNQILRTVLINVLLTYCTPAIAQEVTAMVHVDVQDLVETNPSDLQKLEDQAAEMGVILDWQQYRVAAYGYPDDFIFDNSPTSPAQLVKNEVVAHTPAAYQIVETTHAYEINSDHFRECTYDLQSADGKTLASSETFGRKKARAQWPAPFCHFGMKKSEYWLPLVQQAVNDGLKK
jgi:hypothetical protein